jgi:hypothetical protein
MEPGGVVTFDNSINHHKKNKKNTRKTAPQTPQRSVHVHSLNEHISTVVGGLNFDDLLEGSFDNIRREVVICIHGTPEAPWGRRTLVLIRQALCSPQYMCTIVRFSECYTGFWT